MAKLYPVIRNKLAPEAIDGKIKISSPGGLEPPTFRLTAERANRLRHGDDALGFISHGYKIKDIS